MNWEKSDSQYCDCGYSGGWDITKIKGAKGETIISGYSSPDFHYTTEQVREKIYKLYSERYEGKYIVIIKLEITRDDRNPTMESFF